jgi:uncharacterized coiled-coil protein SlyX
VKPRKPKSVYVEINQRAHERNGSAVEDGVTPEPARAARPAANGRRPSLSFLLTEAGIASYEQISEALAEGKEKGEKLGQVVVRHGWVTEDRLAALLAQQWQLPLVDETKLELDPVVVARLSPATARALGAAPLFVRRGATVVAVADPSVERFEAVEAELGGEVSFVVVERSLLERLVSGTLPVAHRAATMDGVERTAALLSEIQGEVARLAEAAREAEQRVAEQDGLIKSLQEALAAREVTIDLLRTKLADLLRALDA